MSVVADVTVPAEDFALGRLLEIHGGFRVRLETLVPTGEAAMPYLWVPIEKAEAVERILREDALVEDVDVVDEADDEALVRVRWAPDIDGLVAALRDADAVLLEATGTGDDWEFHLRFPDPGTLSAFHEACRAEGYDLQLRRVDHAANPGAGDDPEYGLTPQQAETIAAALEMGYFAVTREATVSDLADRLGVSDQAVSERLRRGLARLVANTLAADAHPEDEREWERGR